MKKHTFYILLTVISFLSASCSNFNLWEDENEQVSQTIEISNIDNIQIESLYHIELVQDTEEYIIATGTKAQLNKLEISPKGNTIILKNDYSNLIKIILQ